MSEAKFKVGDRVRVIERSIFAPYGEEFVITEVRSGGDHPFKGGGDYYYGGDRGGFGVWENYLEPVEPEEPYSFSTTFTVDKVDVNEGALFALLKDFGEPRYEARFIPATTPKEEDWADPLRDLQEQVGGDNTDRGFHDELEELQLTEGPDSAIRNYFAAKAMLIVSEVSEAVEELRNGHAYDEYYESEGGKPEGFGTELADVIIRALDLLWQADLDAAELIQRKLSFNRLRGNMHGGKKF